MADDQQADTAVELIRDLLTEVSHWAGRRGARSDAGRCRTGDRQQIVRVSRIRELRQVE